MKTKLFLIILCACMALAACGRQNAPVAPEGSIYPRTYY